MRAGGDEMSASCLALLHDERGGLYRYQARSSGVGGNARMPWMMEASVDKEVVRGEGCLSSASSGCVQSRTAMVQGASRAMVAIVNLGDQRSRRKETSCKEDENGIETGRCGMLNAELLDAKEEGESN